MSLLLLNPAHGANHLNPASAITHYNERRAVAHLDEVISQPEVIAPLRPPPADLTSSVNQKAMGFTPQATSRKNMSPSF